MADERYCTYLASILLHISRHLMFDLSFSGLSAVVSTKVCPLPLSSCPLCDVCHSLCFLERTPCHLQSAGSNDCVATISPLIIRPAIPENGWLRKFRPELGKRKKKIQLCCVSM